MLLALDKVLLRYHHIITVYQKELTEQNLTETLNLTEQNLTEQNLTTKLNRTKLKQHSSSAAISTQCSSQSMASRATPRPPTTPGYYRSLNSAAISRLYVVSVQCKGAVHSVYAPIW